MKNFKGDLTLFNIDTKRKSTVGQNVKQKKHLVQFENGFIHKSIE